MIFKIATWNVNSLRVRLTHVLDWLALHKPDVLALQETKLTDDDFPIAEINQAGYQVVFSGQRTYNGVAILSKKMGKDILTDFPSLIDPQRRVLGMTIDDMRIINLYIPNGESVGSAKYDYKLNWLNALTVHLELELQQFPKIVILGDFNIAPAEIDVHDPAEWQGKVLFSEPERAAFQRLVHMGLQDCFRLHAQPEKSFSWWDYRMNGFKRNRGLRIDHILATPALASHCSTCTIDKVPRGLERPSDHAPVLAEFHI
jgi:exodeoxyribonuclease III